jgi:hypothetical protein
MKQCSRTKAQKEAFNGLVIKKDLTGSRLIAGTDNFKVPKLDIAVRKKLSTGGLATTRRKAPSYRRRTT